MDIDFGPQDPISQLSGLAEYDGKIILNTDTDYNMTLDGFVTSCGSCNLVADIGWKIIDDMGIERAEASTPYSNLPYGGGLASFSRQMAPLNFDTEGSFTMI